MIRARFPRPVTSRLPSVPARPPIRRADPGAERAGVASFVVHEHRARSLHYDLRLEHNGVLVSWAVPKGLPVDGRNNRLAIQTAERPLALEGPDAPTEQAGRGGEELRLWDRGRYECELWSEDEIDVVLHGERATGRYALVHTGDSHWLVHHTMS